MDKWLHFLFIIVEWFGRFVFLYMLVVIFFYLSLLVISALQLRRSFQLNTTKPYESLLRSSYTKPLSILVPAYNEQQGINGSVRSLLNIEYPQFEIIVINDGSKDATLQMMVERFQMEPIDRAVRQLLETNPVLGVYQSKIYPHLYVIDKVNGGKADALNCGINYASYPYFCSLDGDSVLEREAFLKIMKPMLESNEDIMATGGSVRIANGSKIESGDVQSIGLSPNPIVVMQEVEYLRAFLMGRIGLSKHNLLLIVSGAFGVFSKHWVVEAGGYLKDTVGEDMELVVRLHRMNKERKLNKKIIYVPDAVCWTEAPESVKYLRRQRNRWHRGLLESLWKHRSMLLNPKYGTVGMVSLPYFVFIELLGPVIELSAYSLLLISLLFGGVYAEFAILLFFVSILYGSIFSMGAVLLEEWSLKKYPSVRDVVRLFFYAMTESLWYRPLTVYWRFEGFIQQIMGKRSWGEMQRKGVSS